MELIETNDLFENEDIVLINGIFKIDDLYIKRIDVGIKDTNGDIVDIITVKSAVV